MPDIKVYPNYSPRLVIVDSPDTELTTQQTVTLIRGWEDLPPFLSYLKMVNKASGGEDLGGGTKVGYTVELANTKVGFEPRTTPASTGTATSADSTGVFLTDSGADFVTDGIEPGAIVINFTDGSVTTVLTVVNANTLKCFPLDAGTLNTWTISDSYKVWNMVLCELSGGNTTALDAAGSNMASILPTFGVFAVRTSSSSATLADIEALQAASFGDKVVLDVINGSTDSNFPTGTYERPAKTKALALSIASTRGLNTIKVIGDLTLSNGDDFTAYTLVGQSPQLTTITIETAAVVDNCQFESCTVEGILDNGAHMKDVALGTINYINGEIHTSLLTDIVTLGGGANAILIDCKDGTYGTGAPEINMGGSGQSLTVTGYRGFLKLTNKSGSEYAVITLDGGELEITSSVTVGTIVILGTGSVIDNSNGATIIDKVVRRAMTVGEYSALK